MSDGIFSTSEEFLSGSEELNQTRRERQKRKKLSSGGSSDVANMNELKEEVKNIKEFLKKIDGKLECLAELKEEISSVAKNVEKIWQKVETIEKRCDRMEEKVNRLEESDKKCQDMLRKLEERSIDLEARSRRNNLMFYGVREGEKEDCEVVIKRILSDSCQIRDVVIERAHRTGKGSPGNPRPIIVKFLDFNAKMRVQKAKRRLPQQVRVGDDLPWAVREAQRKLVPECKAAREEGKHAYVAYPARLVIEGREVGTERPTLNPPTVTAHRDPDRDGHGRNGETRDNRHGTQADDKYSRDAGRSGNRGAWRGRGTGARGGRGGR